MKYGEKTPIEDSLEQYFVSIHSAFELNPSLEVQSEQIVVGGILRILRTYRLSDEELKQIATNDQFEAGIVTTRTSPQDNDDPEWVHLSLVDKGPSPDSVTTYMLDKAVGLGPTEEKCFRYSLAKILPYLEEIDDNSLDDDWSEDEEAFADFVDSEMTTITGEDVAIFDRLATVLSR